jgi:para-nitrobenzyl esterase
VHTSFGSEPSIFPSVIVETTGGRVEGIEVPRPDGTTIHQFRGIPYAAAARFGPTRPVSWSGVRAGDRFGPVAPQLTSPTDALLGVTEQVWSEDCLSLNVVTPEVGGGGRPVLVWIHGGGFSRGAGSLPFYEASNLSGLGDVVVVTLNYRLGALGFLYLDHLLDGVEGSGGNGLRDQVAALRWVRANVAAFGGDPGRVTVFGESAGAMSVAALLAAPEARGLFHAAVAQSGTAAHLLTPEQAAVVTDLVLAEVDLSPGDAAQLADEPAERLLDAQTAIELRYLTNPPGTGGTPTSGPRYMQLPFQPVVDEVTLPGSPPDAVQDGAAAGVPLVVGTTRDEWNLFMLQDGGAMDDARLQRRAGRLFGEAADEVVAAYRDAVAADPSPAAAAWSLAGGNGAGPAGEGPDNRAVWAAMATDHVFRMPAIRLAEAQLPHAPVAMYRFDHPSAAFGGLPGACHGIDVPFVFGNVEVAGVAMLLGGVDDGTRHLARRCVGAWAAMAHDGAPAHADLDWPRYDLDRRPTCILDRDTRVDHDPEAPRRTLLAGLEADRSR